ncbi:MAG: hypothetical protein NC826_02025 [Candidatus Omnitrophica bacterium]|nr:hypothetical protein [Candidatus Omnitrophota bacterium]
MPKERFLKKIGKLFLKLERQQSGILNFKIIVVDNGYSAFGHLFSCINNLRNSFKDVEITVLTHPYRVEFIKNNLTDIEIVVSKNRFLPKKIRPAIELIWLNRKRFDFIVLLTLDVIITIACVLFVRRRTYVYHEEHKWSLLQRKTLDEYLVYIPIFIANIFIFIYLVIYVIFIYLNRPIKLRWRKEF